MPILEKPEEQLDTVNAALTYLVDTGEKPVTYTSAPGTTPAERAGRYEQRMVTIHNGRLIAGRLSIEREGFLLVKHETQVGDFYDEEQVRSIYYPEMERLIRDLTGASKVLIFDHTLRAEDEAIRTEKKVREPVRRAHNDYTDWSAPKRVRDLLLPQEAEERLRRRFAVIQTWRPVRHPVQSAPLAIADAQSIAPEDLIAAERRYPDRVGETQHLTFNPNHRWYYFPDMKRNEAVVFKTFDSEKDGRARFTAHTSFDDPASLPDAPARESIEIRSLAFF